MWKSISRKRNTSQIASAREMEKEGVNIGEFQIKLLQKIEELTLYTIEQNKKLNKQNRQIKYQNDKIDVQNKEIEGLKDELKKIKNSL